VKRKFQIIGILIITLLTYFNVVQAQGYKINKVVIDAGHGGTDPGCIGSKTKEKDIALLLATKLGDYIKQYFPTVKVIYTRSTDTFVELYKRAQIANDNKADLFISIHCNANPSKAPYGSETYVMGLHKSQANLDVAQKENASILMEDSYITNYDGFEPNTEEAYIIFSLYQNAYLDLSQNLAIKIQKQMKEKVGLYDRGVKQAGFLVLYKTAMPSILFEAGFLSNLKDEEFLSTAKGQDYVASGLFRAFKEYKNELEKNSMDKDKEDSVPEIKNDTLPYHTIVKDISKEVNDTLVNNIVFKIQFATCDVKKPINSPDFKELKDVQEVYHNGLYKYLTGNEKKSGDALALLKKVHDLGFKDAFIVAFQNGERISPQQAMKLIKKN